MITKKKLSTKPIKIEVPTRDETDFNQQDSVRDDGALPESALPESALPESALQLTREKDSEVQESTFFEIPENDLLENTLPEYKKVAMRLSKESAERLRQFRGETGIPYEILVDVMVRNWDNLPQKTQNAYLKESQKVRGQRLIAGQEKAMFTTQKRYAQN